MQEVIELNSLKGGEYAGDHDALANFRRNAEDCGLSMETVWRVYAGKHWDAVTQYIKDLNTGVERKRLEKIEGRVDDLITYLILFKGILHETQVRKLVLLPHPQEADKKFTGERSFDERIPGEKGRA
jgi:hypothetical protein